MTLADEDSNLIPTDDVHRAILGNVAMQVAVAKKEKVENKLRKTLPEAQRTQGIESIT